jgi:hypothetical protein
VTEQEWLSCADPKPMLAFLESSRRASRRKLRLFACASCRRIWHLLPDERSGNAVATSELYADRLVRRKELDRSRGQALANVADSVTTPAAFAACSAARPQLAPAWVAFLAQQAVARGGDPCHDPDGERRTQAAILRDLFGNPCRPVSLDPAWRTSAAVSLACAAYEERALPSGHLDPARLAVLADAVEEAGCTNPDILDHLRGPGPHTRGCWAVDLLTERE